jgi:hypothetical protein
MSAKITSHNSGFQTSYMIEGTREEIEAAIDRIEANYHPMGYGTSFKPIEQREDGSLVAHGSHYNSCD